MRGGLRRGGTSLTHREAVKPVRDLLQKSVGKPASNKIQFPWWVFAVFVICFMGENALLTAQNQRYAHVMVNDYVEVPLYLLLGIVMIAYLFLPLFHRKKKKIISVCALCATVVCLAAANIVYFTSLPPHTYDDAIKAVIADGRGGSEMIMREFPQCRYAKQDPAGLIGYDYVITLQKDGVRENLIVDPVTGRIVGTLTEEEITGVAPSASLSPSPSTFVP